MGGAGNLDDVRCLSAQIKRCRRIGGDGELECNPVIVMGIIYT